MNTLKAVLVFAVVFICPMSAGDDISVNIVQNGLHGHLNNDKDIQLLSQQLEEIKMQLSQRQEQVQRDYVLKLSPEIEAMLISQGQSAEEARKKSLELAKLQCMMESKKLEKTLDYLTYKRGMDSYDRNQTNKTGLTSQNSGQGFKRGMQKDKIDHDITKQVSGQIHTENVLALTGNIALTDKVTTGKIALTDKVTTSAEADAKRKHELDLLRLKSQINNNETSKFKTEQELFEINKNLSGINGRIASIYRKIDSWEIAGNANPATAQKNIKKLELDLKTEMQRKADLEFRKKYLLK